MKKLDHQHLGPYLITAKISSHAFQLGLPLDLCQIHPIFHVSLLKPATTSKIPGCHIDPPPPIEIDSELEFEVSEVFDSCIKQKHLEYPIVWKAYEDTSEAITWEPSENLSNVKCKLAQFHANNLTKPHHLP